MDFTALRAVAVAATTAAETASPKSGLLDGSVRAGIGFSVEHVDADIVA
jgi:hypothetical protein